DGSEVGLFRKRLARQAETDYVEFPGAGDLVAMVIHAGAVGANHDTTVCSQCAGLIGVRSRRVSHIEAARGNHHYDDCELCLSLDRELLRIVPEVVPTLSPEDRLRLGVQ